MMCSPHTLNHSFDTRAARGVVSAAPDVFPEVRCAVFFLSSRSH